MRVNKRAIGVLHAQSSAPNGFTSADGTVLQTLADQAAVALENARLHAETERRAEQLASLHDLDRAITVSLRISDVYHAFSRHAARLLPYDRMSITLLEGDEMRVTYATGEAEATLAAGAVLPLKTSAVGWVAVQGQPLLRNNLAAEARFAEDEQLIAGGIRSAVIIPLRVKREIIGTWNIGSRQVGAYHPDCLTMAQSMADQLAAAIENAQLHEDLQAQLGALQEAQARLVQNEKLVAMGELVAGVAHELVNPLTVIYGYAQLLKFSQVSDKTRRELDKIVAEAKRMDTIVHALLDFARQCPPEPKPVQINKVLSSTLELADHDLSRHNVTWTTQFCPDPPLTAGDPHQLRQVFVNLVTNACQAMSKANGGGHLTITTEVAPSTFIGHHAEAAPVIRVVVEDNGPGISPDVLPRIFDPFFTTKPTGEGTGLGLSICHGIVSEHGGHIWAESHPGQGALFFLELPIISSETWSQVSAQGR
jgi:signal transduction histidine kinase